MTSGDNRSGSREEIEASLKESYEYRDFVLSELDRRESVLEGRQNEITELENEIAQSGMGHGSSILQFQAVSSYRASLKQKLKTLKSKLNEYQVDVDRANDRLEMVNEEIDELGKALSNLSSGN